jgi:hypothetical protein
VKRKTVPSIPHCDVSWPWYVNPSHGVAPLPVPVSNAMQKIVVETLTYKHVHALAVEIRCYSCSVVDIPNTIDVVNFRRPHIAATRCRGGAVDHFLG